MGENHEGRPLAGAASYIVGDIHSLAPETDTERCTRCSHPIRVEASIEAGLGPHCRRVMAA